MLPAMPPLSHRFRSFSLRTLLVLMTIAAISAAWLASQRRIVWERRAARAAWSSRYGVIVMAVEPDGPGIIRPPRVTPPPTVSKVRGMLGDQAVEYILILRDITNVDPGEAARLFPEATIRVQ